jgi:small subunit ribosomal protein S24e
MQLYEPKKVAPRGAPSITSHTTVPLSDGTEISYEKARAFMDYYCRRYKFRQDITYEEVPQRGANSTWEAMMLVDDRRIGIGSGTNKKSAQIASYLDVAQYLEKCDPELWQTFVEVAKTGGDLGLAPRVHFRVGAELEEEIRDLCYHIKRSVLYKNRPALSQPKPDSADSPDHDVSAATVSGPWRYQRTPRPQALKAKSEMLLKRQKAYLTDPTQETMRQTRMSLPVYSRSEDVLKAINSNEVTILLAATGSGKTTQVPQLILDEYIARGEGALCNIVCTQPRRIAALSVANRVARERGESVGSTVGYQVRFESRSPEDHGSITFCTTGVFLKRMQSVLQKNGGIGSMDHVTHVIVDEVHERDIDTDLLLVVLKRLLADRKARNLPIKVVLMSATIDPSLFQHYFPDAQGHPAPAIEVPGRAFPVEKHFLEDYLPHLRTAPGAAWVFAQSQVIPYLQNEVSMESLTSLGLRLNTEQSAQRDEDFELPSALIALVISHVLRSSTDGHVLVFLPGWEEMIAVVKCLEDETGPFHAVFSDPEKYKVHLLHSSIPLADQQVIFDPPPEGVRRIILATNIAETSLTIPDIVYVVDTAKVKEIRYDPDRHMSSLVSAWTGSSNLNQRAGRAGRHRPGQYYGVLGKNRVAGLQAYQTVEMKRADLSNVVMHVKALDFPGMTVEEVLESAIEPPTNERVVAAIRNLQMAGALDGQNNVTPLGRVLLQLPIDAQMGRLVLFGSFFRCLDNALTLAAILTNRDPFLAPLHLRDQAAARKNSFTSSEFRSDVLAILQAYISWSAKQEARQFAAANRFCIDNFLSKPTLITIQKIRGHILQSLYHSGVISVSAGGNVGSLGSGRNLRVPPELNANEKSTPLLAALIALGSQPKFAVRASERVYRTAQDKV